MSYKEFLHCIIPYNHNRPKANKYWSTHKDEIDHILHYADVDGDGTISFPEFFFFVLVLQTPSKYIYKDFENYGGKMTIDEFSKVLSGHKKKTIFGSKYNIRKDDEGEFLMVNR